MVDEEELDDDEEEAKEEEEGEEDEEEYKDFPPSLSPSNLVSFPTHSQIPFRGRNFRL